MVDAYLVDLATATGNVAVIEAALDDLRAHCRGARVGVEVERELAARTAHPGARLAARRRGRARHHPAGEPRARCASCCPSAVELVVKTGVMPRELLEIAWDEPERWTHGSDRLVVHWPGAPALRPVHEASVVEARRAAGLDPS